jgi:hypothetical protein
MTSSSYMLDRETPGSTRNIIDAHSNAPFVQQTQQNTYRSSYGTSSPLPHTTTTASYHYHGYGTSSNEYSESKKVIADVRLYLVENKKLSLLILVTRSSSFIKKRFRKKRCTYSRIIINEVNLK